MKKPPTPDFTGLDAGDRQFILDGLKRGMTRREALTWMVAGGLTAASAGSLFTRAGQAMAATPNKGGHLRFGSSQGSTSDSMNPSQVSSAIVTMALFATANALTEVDADGRLAPLLAESWESEPGARVWRFKLQKDVTFSNGKPLTPEDVIGSINLHRAEDSKSEVQAFAKQIESMRADGSDTVVITLAEGNADFPYVLSSSSFAILATRDGKPVLDNYSGVGAFTLESFEPGVKLTMKRNPDYFRADSIHLDSVEMLYIADVTARQNALITGEMDVIDRLDLKTIHLFERNKDVQIVNLPSTLHPSLPMLTDVAPFDNVDVRLALKYAVNREEILNKVLRGYGTIGNDQPISPAYRYFNADLEQRIYDPDKARFHAKKAGLDNLAVEYSTSESIFSGAIDTAQLIAESAKKAGITINIKREPNDGYWSNVWLKKPWCASFWSGRPTEDWMLSQAYSASSSWNETRWKNERFESLLKSARTELDDAKRQSLYGDMQRLIRDDGGAVIPVFSNHVFAHANTVGHPDKIANNWDLDGYKLFDRWWKS